MPCWHLYMIRTGNGHIYTGIATDVARRFNEHAQQGAKCARYLRGRAPLELVYTAPAGARAFALRLEHRVKRLPRRRKESIIKRNPDSTELAAMLEMAVDDTL